MTSISVVIPAYNERDRIVPILEDLAIFCKSYKQIKEVIVVDDGSTDNGATVERALKYTFKLPLRVERLAKNQGKWGAIRHGIESATCDWVLVLDSDNSISIWEMAPLMDSHFSTNLDDHIAWFGTRFGKDAVVENKSWMRQLMSKGYRQYVRMAQRYATGRAPVDDMQCPFKLFRKSDMVYPIFANRFAGDIELYCSLRWTKIVNKPVKFVHMKGSKIRSSDIVKMAWETAKIARRCRKIYRKPTA